MRTTLTAGLAALILTFAGRQECRAQRVVVEELRPRRRTLPKGRLDFTPPVPVHVRLPDGMRPPRRPGARPLRPRRRRGRASRRNRAWVPVLSVESFEASGFPPTSWSTWDSVTDNGEHHWGRTDYTAQDGTHSAWCAGGGADALDPATDNYPDQATSWLQYGPFSLPAGQRAVAQFAYWNETEAEFDYFYWLIKAPDIDLWGGYWGYGVSGATGGWHVVDFDLNNVIGLGDLAGQTELYLAFYFHTDDGVTFKGTFLDYVSIQTTEDPAPSPTWTVMLYLDGDNAQELDAIEDFRELAPMAANPDVRFVSLMDRAAGYAGDDPDKFYYDDWTTTRRYVLKQDTDLWTRPTPPRDYEDLGELNMGDPQTLTDFVTWAQTNHPATYYALVIWGNGTGWGPAPPKGPTAEGGLKQRDVLYDEDADDYLTTGELRQALTGLGDRIDVVAFDADLMGSIEVVYELATVTDHVVASEDVRPIVPLSPERPLDFPYHTMFSPSVINATTTPQQLCGGLVAAYSAYYDLLDLGGLAAWQTAGVTDASTALSAFADALLLGLSSERPAIDASRAAAQRFDGTVDLHDFAAEVFANSADPGIQSAAQGLMAAIVASSFMTAEWHDAEHYGANAADMRGLAGYLPLNATDPAYAAYNGTTLKFLANPAQMWDDFLAAYLMPQAPSGLSASDRPADNGDAVELSWTRSPDDGAGGRDDVTEYRVYRIVGGSATKGGRAAVATVSADDSETYNYTDDGLTPGQEYCYTVRAYNGLESADSNEECVSPTDETPPGAPQNLVAADRADDQGGAIDLSWDRSDDDGQGAGDAIEYHVIRDGTQVHVVAATGAASYEWTDTDRTDGQEYCYKIRAFDGTSESGDSNESCAASLDNTAPGAPTNVAASDVADDQGGAVDLSWDRSADD
ncbi:MAG: clostripain-related cysteine peptidase, partial [Armatimonadota bacterium]